MTVAAASWIGAAKERCDFFLHRTAVAAAFNKLFFPDFDPPVGTLLAYGHRDHVGPTLR